MTYPESDNETWAFFCEAHEKNIHVNGPLLQSQASEIAMKYNYDKFSASNGWLESFCDRHQIKMANLHGESAEVSDEVVHQWHLELPNITNGYTLRDIYNCDETSIFFRALPTKSYIAPEESHSGVKVSKERFRSTSLC